MLACLLSLDTFNRSFWCHITAVFVCIQIMQRISVQFLFLTYILPISKITADFDTLQQ